jgi:hypothetical protein
MGYLFAGWDQIKTRGMTYHCEAMPALFGLCLGLFNITLHRLYIVEDCA